jgi:hypothetical protein
VLVQPVNNCRPMQKKIVRFCWRVLSSMAARRESQRSAVVTRSSRTTSKGDPLRTPSRCKFRKLGSAVMPADRLYPRRSDIKGR